MNKIYFLILVVLCLSLPTFRANGLSVRPPTLADMVRNAEFIALVQIKKVTSHYATSQAIQRSVSDDNIRFKYPEIITKYEVSISRTYKGSLPHRVVVTQEGGCVLNTCFSSPFNPDFRAGDEAIIFLHRFGTDEMQHYFGTHSTFKIRNDDTLAASGEDLSVFEKKIRQFLSERHHEK